jgi:branched-chain amino acid transport system permease protein
MGLKHFFHILLLLAVATIIQLVTYFSGTQYYLTQLTMVAYYSIVIIGLCLVMGYAGQMSLGHAGFFAIGGYISAVLTTYNLTPCKDYWLVAMIDRIGLLTAVTDLYGEESLIMHAWPACIIAVFCVLIISYIIGGPVLKLKGHYLAMATLGFGTIVYSIVLGTEIFGEADGISDVPGFPILPGLTINGDMNNRIENYYIAWIAVAIGLFLLLNLVNSRVGRALRSIHSAEDAANAMGVNTPRYKLYAFIISAVFAAIAGVMMTHYNGGIGPGESSVMKSIRYVAIVTVGGMANLWGALVMCIVLNFLSLRGFFGSYDDAVFGIVLIAIMLFSPQGLFRMYLFHQIKDKFIRGKK